MRPIAPLLKNIFTTTTFRHGSGERALLAAWRNPAWPHGRKQRRSVIPQLLE